MGPFKSDAPLKPVIIEKMEIISPAGAASEAPATSRGMTGTFG